MKFRQIYRLRSLVLVALFLCVVGFSSTQVFGFNGSRAMESIQAQLDMGPRYPTSPGHLVIRQWIQNRLKKTAGKIVVDSFKYVDAHQQVYDLATLMFRYNPERTRRVLLGAHYDTRRYADKDLDDPYAPLAGANDGASGVAVLVELSKNLPAILKGKDFGVDLVFFDAEEGELDPKGRPWRPIGAIHFANKLKQFYEHAPLELAIVVDMVCDKDLQLKLERHSLESGAAAQVWKLWKIGAKYTDRFMAEYGFRVYDDHYPLIQKGVPSILLIDFDYPPWHTQKDQIDQCAAKSLQAVGQTLEDFLAQY